MKTRTICCKLLTTTAICKVLKETSERFSDACNYVLEVAIREKTHNAIKLHHLCYAEVRKRFGLSANLAVRSIRRVVSCMTKLKGSRNRPKIFKPKSIDYDARIFSYRQADESVSLTTIKGRIRIPMILGEHQRKQLIGKSPTCATVINKSGIWYIHIVVDFVAEPFDGDGIMGIDLGINNIATTSTGTRIEGKTRQQYKQKRHAIRASLQSKNTQGSKNLLKRLANKESRRIQHENHVISKSIVEEAIRHNCGLIRMERLKHIRSKTKTWNKHRNRMIAGWSFYQLQQFVQYKAEGLSISVEFIDPSYTSLTCHRCFELGSRNGERFNCTTCGISHADVNASHVIALGGASVNTPELGVCTPKSPRL